MKEKTEQGNLSRRNFLALAGAGAGTVMLTGLAACSPSGSSDSAHADEAPEVANADWLGSAPEIADSDIVKSKETDLLIVGAGNAGMSAAATAADLEMDFIVCEKRDSVQHARHWVGGVNTKWHAEAGLTVDKGKILNELTRYASGKCQQDVWKVWINESAETIEFIDGIMAASGMDLYLDTEGYGTPTGGTDYYVPPIQHMWYDPADLTGPLSLAGEMTQKHRNLVLEEYVASKGYEVSYDHKLVKLIQTESGRVSGAIFETSEGYIQISAHKGVLLTTGGYAANPVMTNALAPTINQSCTAVYYAPSSLGEGIKAGLWAGASMDYESAPMIFDRGMVEPGVDSGYVGEGMDASFPSPDGSSPLGSLPFMKVNRYGKRFMNESTPYDSTCFGASRQPGGVWCSIFDANGAADAARFSVVGCVKIAADIFQVGPIDAVFERYFDLGVLVKADTLEELADKLQLPQEAFLEQVKRYNELYEAQVDEDYGKEAYRLSAISQAPFYGFWCGGALLTTLDGLQINADMQVLDSNREVIEGLYAAGDTSGSLFSGNYPEYLVGCACGRTITEGRHAVKSIAGKA